MSSRVIPCLRYADAPAMIDWLCRVFGFQRHLVVEDGKGGITHAQLTLGNGMIMLGSARKDEFGQMQGTAEALGGNSQSPYLVVEDVDAVARRSEEGGGVITREPQDEPYGGRGASLRDPESYLWNIGSYDPWVEDSSNR